MKYKTSDVFGVRSQLIESYIERPSVDELFSAALQDKNQVIVYGSSKQGKTSLTLKHLDPDGYVKVECSPQTQAIDIYRSILRQSNITYFESDTQGLSFEIASNINAGVKVKVPFMGEANLGAGTADKQTKTNTSKELYIEYNLELAQDVSELLRKKGIEKFIVLENFHYLSPEVQERLAYDLRVFQDLGVIFIVLGIWREANRLVQFNGDLLDRVTEVPVEPWLNEDFARVIEKGSKLLNVDFTRIQEKLIKSSFDSVGVVQELCKQCCIAAGVKETSDKTITISEEDLLSALETKAGEYGGRHIRNFESFVDIARKTSNQSGKPSLAFPFYFIQLLLKTDLDNIEQGLSRSTLLEGVRKVHHRPEDVRSGDLGAFLHNITQHQINKRIQPPFVDYDRGSKLLKIIDSSLYFFLRHCDREAILADIPHPILDFSEDLLTDLDEPESATS
ncbi:hypothetical protein [Pseudomonas thivervalensis]|uniref:hypothetical protein n=1 Tax=Pseudomonas thivervalensis TaxID=86265 RepID=UPI00069F0333|nr:hypothetical protein [Pseudomonas thivervalensis]OAB54172.1 hypothetical protein APS14_19195 [Pseudomonas thivervalensis]SDG42093.1 hypothetical protein SAMN04490204_4220 [Pseudomonas thivervalensis]